MSELPDYLLGSRPAELVRLGEQHVVWAEQAHHAWNRAGFTRGQVLLDLGAGPGYATFSLARIVGPEGRVIALEPAPRFHAYLESERERRELSQLEVRATTIEEVELEAGSLDGAYARWVLSFLADAEAAVAKVAAALRPGGVFAVQDYFNYDALTLAPRSPALDRVLAAVTASWQDSGGDIDVGSSLPAYFERQGLEVRELRPLIRIGRPGSQVWNWPRTFFWGFVPRLVEDEYLTRAEGEAFFREWEERERTPGAFLFTPPMVEIIGVKT